MTTAVEPYIGHSPGLRPADREVSDATRRDLVEAVPDNTRRAYGRWIRDFSEWCDANDRTALPATAETLTEYIRTAKDLGRGVSSLRQAIAAIRSAHAVVGHQDQPPAYAARTIIRGHARRQAAAGIRTKQAPPLLIDDLRRLTAVCDPTSMRGARDRLILTVGWGSLLRRSELAALRFGDVRPCANPADGLDVFIAASKTDKEAGGALRTVPPGTHPDSDAPPMLAAYRVARRNAGLDPHGYLFRSLEVGGRIGDGMTGDAVNDLVKDLAHKAGFPNWADYSAHSLRAGGATGMYLRGKTLDEITEQGRWAKGSTVVMGYVRAVDRTRHNAMSGVM